MDNTIAGSIYDSTLLRLLFPGRMQKIVAHDFRYDPRMRLSDLKHAGTLFAWKN